ncbi:MAG: hypothetical protein HOV80_38425 [Polyangiaceae bacterium]|nr:hypothetical protein [Polyangiaceae bacterium]
MRLARLALVFAVSMVCALGGAAPAEAAGSSGWIGDRGEKLLGDDTLAVHVLVPLCDNDQIDCGSTRAGDPDDLGHNLYWGAVFGHKRFFSRKASTFSLLSTTTEAGGTLERSVFRKTTSGKPFGRDKEVEVILILDAIHGGSIDDAVDRFYREAERGAWIHFKQGLKSRSVRADVVGYAGHNRMMDGKKPPPKQKEDKKAGAPIDSFVLACDSNGYFKVPLEERGSRPLLLTSALMAPEGYVLEAVVEGLTRNESRTLIRKRTVAAYAKWQNITEKTAGPIFAKLD